MLLAFDLHENDCRKGKDVPYVSHLLSVSALVLKDGGTEDEAIAALLHDALEDHPDKITYTDLKDRFGKNVADIVRACSDTPDDFKGGEKPPWKKRKQKYLDHLEHAPISVLRVTLADKLHNCRDLRNDLRMHGKKSGSASMLRVRNRYGFTIAFFSSSRSASIHNRCFCSLKRSLLK
jgi:(p)ppGpp synthase/HD superfamily hydrolase